MTIFHKCEDYLGKAKSKQQNLIASCPRCESLYVCRWKWYVPLSIRAGGYYYWEPVKIKKAKSK